MNVEPYNTLTTLYDALHEEVMSSQGHQGRGIEQKVNALVSYIQNHTTDLSQKLAENESQRKLYEDITIDIQSLESPSGEIVLKEIQSLFFKSNLLKLEELVKNPDQLVSWLNEREGDPITREDLNSSPLKVLDAFDKIREFSTLPQEFQSEFDKTLSKMVVSSLCLENKIVEEVNALFKNNQIDARALACFVNAKQIALKDLKLPVESLNGLAPYLNYVDCRDVEFKDGDKAQNFIENCSKAYQIFINSRKIKEVKRLPKALKELDCRNCTSLTTLPLVGLTALEKLDCRDCTSLTTLSLEGLTALKKLDCSGSTSLMTLSLSGLTALEKLECRDCTSLTTLSLEGLTALKKLYCSYCTSLTALSLVRLTALEKLDCTRCTSLTALSLVGLTGLKELYCGGCTSLTTLSLVALTALEKLYCARCTSLTALSFLGLEALIEILCNSCQNLTSLGDSLPNTLQTLNCEDCPSLAQLPQVPPTAAVYSGNSRCGHLNRFQVNPSDVQEKPLELLLRLGEILLQNKPFPNIVYIDPLTGEEDQGIDAGGLRRQFIYDLCQRLFKNPTEFPFIENVGSTTGNFPIVDLTKNDQILRLRTLARLIAFGATSDALITGPILSQNFYNAALTLAKDPLIENFQVPLTDKQKKELYFLAEYGYKPKIEENITKEEEQFLVIGDSIAIVAHELKAVLKERLESFTLHQFIAKVQGVTVNAERLLGTISQGNPRIKFQTELAPQIKDFVETFIQKFDNTQTLKEFVKFVLGSESIGIDEQIKVQIALNPSTEHLPITHTCFQSIEFPSYQTYEVFEEKLLIALKAKDTFGLA